MTIFEKNMEIQPSLFGNHGSATPADIDLTHLTPQQIIGGTYLNWDNRFSVTLDNGGNKRSLLYLFDDGRISYYPDYNDIDAICNYCSEKGMYYDSGYSILLPEWLYRMARKAKENEGLT